MHIQWDLVYCIRLVQQKGYLWKLYLEVEIISRVSPLCFISVRSECAAACKYKVRLLNIARGENGVHGCNIEIIDSISIYKMSVCVDFVSDGQITQSPTGILGQVVTKKKYQMFSGELVNGHYDTLLPVIERKMLRNFY